MLEGGGKDYHKVIRPEQDVTGSISAELKQELLRLVGQGIRELTIDLAHVELVDSEGLGLLIAAYNSLKQKGGTLSLINVSGDIYKLFKVMRLCHHFEVTPAG